MAITDDVRISLANEARRKELQVKIAKLQGASDASASLASLISNQNRDRIIQLQQAEAEMAALIAGAGPGITDDYGERSVVDNASLAERNAGQTAVITAIKTKAATGETITKDEGKQVWIDAALASRPEDRKWLLNDPESLLKEYIANVVQSGRITEPTWEAFVAWVTVTPPDQLK